MKLVPLTALITAVLLVAGVAGAEEKKDKKLDPAKNTVDRIRQADPPEVSTTTKPSPVGEPADRWKPKGPSVNPKEPPLPKPKADCHPSMGWRTRQALGCD